MLYNEIAIHQSPHAVDVSDYRQLQATQPHGLQQWENPLRVVVFKCPDMINFKTRDRHIKNIIGLNMFGALNPSLLCDKGVTVQH